MKTYQLEILSNIQVSERYWHMTLNSENIEEPIVPGQFFNIKCGEDELPFLRRPFSIYRINQEEKTIEFLYLVKGAGTVNLTKFKADDQLDVLGPLGIGFRLEEDWDSILLLARGVGIATLAALAQEAAAKNVKCVAILSARSNNDLLAAETLQGFGATVIKVTEEEGTSGVENVQRLVEELIVEHGVKAAFTCGSMRLSRLLQKITFKENIPAQIALEEHMGCAMGVCYACVCNIRESHGIKSVRVCIEGPVFDLEKVVLT
ncbi:dihydroorotate dehydrogenase electron transfer subunit [Planococcus sp. CPCC 101016]|uniref:dihydroorotate dehydrogenase electron transfer subunit n=1 Tax=Planococcus sp. CPCC 101016 TaxID=2599617 RepID=UPI0011B5EFA7|nr:dihydroorotate dehydrogenase electron transfer subunit [Planococcus sp. CPCC 101016]TWT06568.1 dihydroorotate dehydrogenase electron transfer subunit [Planococcus sp. CPCC 101016]